MRRSPAAAVIVLGIAACSAGGEDRLGRVDRPAKIASSSPSAVVASPSSAVASSSSSATPPDASSAPRVTLPSEPFVALAVPGFADAVVALPDDVSSPRAIVVATHGNYDRPEWSCEVFSGVFAKKAFVICPRGVARPDSPAPDDVRFTYVNNAALEKEVDAAIAAFRAQPYAAAATDDRPIWVGFSLGAIMGVAIASRRPSDFPTLVLVEGGVDRLTDGIMAKLAKGGTKRVLLACAQRGCGGAARSRATRLEKLGVRTAVVDAGPVGHTYDGKVAAGVHDALPALLAP